MIFLRGSLVVLSVVLVAWPATHRADELPDQQTLRGWIEDMKSSERGPFARIRWFCKDGSVLPPEPYACKPHGGGSQHGEWTDRVKQLRADGYYVANIYSDLDIDALLARDDHRDIIGQMLIEAFLERIDDGWILRKARYYRGALQAEGERAGGRRLLERLAAEPWWLGRGYLPLRIGTRFVPHERETTSISDVRQTATNLSGKDPGFKHLRNKIHVRPDAGDAALVRAYAAGLTDAENRAEYEAFAEAIDAVYTREPGPERLRAASASKQAGELAPLLTDGAERLAAAADPAARFAVSAELLGALRDSLSATDSSRFRIALLDLSLLLEATHFTAATALRDQLKSLDRRQRIALLGSSIDAVYGAGLISVRQLEAGREVLALLDRDNMTLDAYKSSLDYLALVPGWSDRWLRFHFHNAFERYQVLDPQAGIFTQDLLRGSPLFFYVDVLDGLLRDANTLAGVRNELFGEDVGAGLRSLNPGLARGTLELATDGEVDAYRPDGIYLLPETVSDLPPVAGILTAGEGNPLSHVQLLARNLGIPNVAVDASLTGRLLPWEGERVLLAVSPRGSVRLAVDDGAGTEPEDEKPRTSGALIEPDLDKLDLDRTELLVLDRLRASDSGRVVGPKAAKLGELHHHFPGKVAAGIAIPFGVFRELLRQPYGDTGRSTYEWMVGEYRRLESLPAGSDRRSEETEKFRASLHEWIKSADPGREFSERLRARMAEVFGRDGSYGVFVRSDTNVEDLPGFTGAGLNLTVPNVVGVDNVLAAIPRVWASPFTARAFAWRQSHMSQPEHVYPAVLLLQSVPVNKSGVLVTRDIDTGRRGWLSVAVNEGVGGAVDGQAAESLRIRTDDGSVRLLAQATAAVRRAVSLDGGVSKLPVSDSDWVLETAEVAQLIELERELPRRFPAIVDADGKAAAADIEFGFLDGELKLFQLRPFLESKQARSSTYLKSLDADMVDATRVSVDMNAAPEGS